MTSTADPIGQLLGQHVLNSAPQAASLQPPTTTCNPTLTAALYSHQAMIDLMISQPNYTHEQLCSHFGRPASWLCSVLASDSFQSTLDPVRHLVLDPSLTANMQERFKALAIRTSNVMLTKMDGKEVSDFLVIKAGEVSIKALGLGVKGVEQAALSAPVEKSTDTLAERLLAMMDRNQQQNTIDATTVEIKTDF